MGGTQIPLELLCTLEDPVLTDPLNKMVSSELVTLLSLKISDLIKYFGLWGHLASSQVLDLHSKYLYRRILVEEGVSELRVLIA